jgi:hypothetical protein
MGVLVLWEFMPDAESSITPLEFLLIVGWSVLQRFIVLDGPDGCGKTNKIYY